MFILFVISIERQRKFFFVSIYERVKEMPTTMFSLVMWGILWIIFVKDKQIDAGKEKQSLGYHSNTYIYPQ